PNLCPQCRAQSAHFKHDRRAGAYEITCGRCGRRECHESMYDDDGNYCGFRHEVTNGAGRLFFRYTGDNFFYAHLLHSPTEVLNAENWLRQRLGTGAVDPDSASLMRWDDEVGRMEVVLGEPVYLLAGRVKTVLGLPGDAE